MKFIFKNVISIFTLLLMWVFYVSAVTSNETTSIDFCHLCENDKCFKNGLHQWFADPLLRNGTLDTYNNVVSIFPPLNKTSCKIEIAYNDQVLEEVLIMTNKDKGVGVNNRWSFIKFTPYQYRISRKMNIKEDLPGKYVLRFAENQTVCQYLLWERKTTPNPKELNSAHVKEKMMLNSTVFYLKPSSLLKMCMNFGVSTSSLTSTRCITSKSYTTMNHITCGLYNTNYEFFEGEEYCRAEWIPLRAEFRIKINKSLGINFENLDNFDTDTSEESINVGALICKIKDEHYSFKKFIYRAPFVVGHDNGGKGSSFSMEKTILPIIFFLVLVVALSFGILKYRARHHRKGILQEWKACEFPPDLKMDNVATCKKSGSHGSLAEFKCSCLVLPQWILDHADMIFPTNSIKKLGIIGSGQFGTVYKGTYCQGNAVFPIAIKSLKKRIHSFTEETNLTSSTTTESFGDTGTSQEITDLACSDCDIDSLIDEAKTMFSLGSYNENIVNLQGISYEVDHKYDSLKQFCLILEYCSSGNLRNYLIDHRNEFWTSLMSSPSILVGNSDIDMPLFSSAEKQTNVSLLTIWAYQISKGMDFLSERNIYHGDLAARNVLLTEQLVAKVSDFGLSKRLYHDISQFSLCEDGTATLRLPMKWLALEVLKYGQVIPIKSDVWSFGVLVWELFQLGAEPYRPDITYSSLTEELINGARLPVPTYCPHDVAQIMNSCWQEDPHARPCFSQITKLLHQTTFIQDVLRNKNRNGQDLTIGESTTVYTNVLNNTSMYAQYRTIQQTNLSYMKMDGQSFNNMDIQNDKDETDAIDNDESEPLQKSDTHSENCHYTILRSPTEESESDSGAFSDHCTPSITNTADTEVGNESNLERWQMGRLQSLNEVEEDLKFETC